MPGVLACALPPVFVSLSFSLSLCVCVCSVCVRMYAGMCVWAGEWRVGRGCGAGGGAGGEKQQRGRGCLWKTNHADQCDRTGRRPRRESVSVGT